MSNSMVDLCPVYRQQNAMLQVITDREQPSDAVMRVFHTNYFYGLLDVLADTFPETKKVLGDGFKAFARDYIYETPLLSGDRTFYGLGFPVFLSGHKGLKSYAWIADFAAFEAALHKAHHADDAEQMTQNDLLSLEAQFSLAPSATVLSVGHNVRELYQASTEDREATLVEASSHLLVGRDADDDYFILYLNDEENTILQQWLNGVSLSDLMANLAAEHHPHLQTLLAKALNYPFLKTES